jgi:hypothetical protein
VRIIQTLLSVSGLIAREIPVYSSVGFDIPAALAHVPEAIERIQFCDVELATIMAIRIK